MDPITLIITALTEGLAAASKDVVSDEIKAGYKKLKGLILSKFGNKEDVSSTLRLVEKKPESNDLKDCFKEELEKVGAENDNELLEQARIFLELVKQAGISYSAEAHNESTIVQGENNTTATHSGVAVRGNAETIQTGDGNVSVNKSVIVTGQGTQIIMGDASVVMTAVDRQSALGRYLRHVISCNRYLQLQGIRSGGQVVNIELDRIYVRLRATRQRTVSDEERWLTEESMLAPGEAHRLRQRPENVTETVTVKVEECLAEYPRLVILGDPGSGKTTLLRYLALLYARDLAETESNLVHNRLGLAEHGRLPIFLPMRQIGAYLGKHQPENDGTEGHALLLDLLRLSLKNAQIELPEDFFAEWLNTGNTVILLDGLDEVADPELRQRVSRLVENFARACPNCRYVVTSRIKGYTGAARLGEEFKLTTVQDFNMDDVRQFLGNWHRLVATGQMGPGASAEAHAREQTAQLIAAIRENDRIRELAINPLMLTVIAMVHRDRVKLPDRRAELYAEAVDVLLGKWEEAKGVKGPPILLDKPFDTGDRRLLLQDLALHMHEQKVKEIEIGELKDFLTRYFANIEPDEREAVHAGERFLNVIEERTGLLNARAEGEYGFSHLTFQEYLAAVAIATRDDYLQFTLQHASDPWWREVVLLEAGYLSTQRKERTTRLIDAITEMKNKDKAEPYYNLILAADCVRDVGESRVPNDLLNNVKEEIRLELATSAPSRWLGPFPSLINKWAKNISWLDRRVAAATALARIGGDRFWSLPYGEPEWVEIPAGEFWMGSDRHSGDERPLYRLRLNTFRVSRTPVTNAQYQLFIADTGHESPGHWEDNRPPKGMESHPVVLVTWHDAMAYCKWLSEKTGREVTLPSEAELEKTARGDQDQRDYPWGDVFDATKCNCVDLKLGQTTPVGIFVEGASPYGCLDMSGNVWEWTRSLYREYPYRPEDGREDISAGEDGFRVLRGGSFDADERSLRCSYRNGYYPFIRFNFIGFRIVLAP